MAYVDSKSENVDTFAAGEGHNSRSKQELLDFEKQLKEREKSETKHLKKMADVQEALDHDLAKKREKEDQETIEWLHKVKIEQLEEEGKRWQAAAKRTADAIEKKWKDTFGDGEKTASTITKISKAVTGQIDGTIDNYLSKQAAISEHLIGTSNSLSSLTSTLNGALASSSIVKQENVYNKLSELVSKGIVANVEQKAFLNALADDFDMLFDASDGSLTRLMKLQREDLTTSRLSVEYTLQSFLNQSYQDSQYIKEAFSGVTEAILQSQSLMGTGAAMSYESAIQSWMGSYYEAGASSSTVTSLAGALNALSSGDISGLGNGISNLVLMGVARAGLDYGSLLTGNLSATDVNSIMSGISGYLQEIGANGNNVVKSQLASLYGVEIADIVAASNLKSNAGGGVSSSSSFLNDASGFISSAVGLQNTWDNMLYSLATNLASNDDEMKAYRIAGVFANSGLGDFIASMGGGLNPVTNILGGAINGAQLITLLPALISTIGDVSSSWSSRGSAAGIYSALTSALSSSTIKVAGTGKSTGMYVSDASNVGGLLDNANMSFSDVSTNANVTADEPTIDDNVATISSDIKSILKFLEDELLTTITEANALASNPYTTAATVAYDFYKS